MRRREERGERGPSLWNLAAPFIRSQRSRLTRMSIAAIFAGFAEAAILVLIARIAVALSSSSSSVDVDLPLLGTQHFEVSTLIIAAGVLVLVRTALQGTATVLSSRATYTVVARQRASLVGQYLAAGWPLQSQQRHGRLQELLTTFAGATATAVGAFSAGSIALFNLLALLATALAVNALASLAAGVAALAIGLALRPLRDALRRRSRRTAAANIDFATGITELGSTLQEVRIFSVEDAVEQRLARLNTRAMELALQTSYVSTSITLLYQGVAMLLMVGALAIAFAADFTALSSLGAVVLIMLRSLSYAQAVQGSVQSLTLAAPYLETLREEEERYRASAMEHGGEDVGAIDDIAFDDVSFAYEPGTPVLRNMSFRVQRGEIIGIVGPSGSGKSTLVQLLLRLREPDEGTIRVGDRDVRRLSLDDWYRHIALVPQEPHLVAGTVADNIRFFRDDVDDAAIERAAKAAHLHEEITAWPAGYATEVGERGSHLSGGQRQRLCIARALVEDPQLMVLDEPTSALDPRSESLMRETIAELAPHTTVFVIAHRLSTVAICDRIMVILNGVLEGFDTPTELERHNPFYREAIRLSSLR